MTPKEITMSNKKQTSLNFYRTELMALVSTGKTDYKTEPEIYEQAKEIEKEHLIKFYIKGCDDTYGMDEEDDDRKDAEKHYKEIFKSE